MNSERNKQPQRAGSGDVRKRLVLPVVCALVLAACGAVDNKGVVTSADLGELPAGPSVDQGSEQAATTLAPDQTTTTATTAVVVTEPTDTSEPTETSEPPDTSTTTSTTTEPVVVDTDLPGDPIDLFADPGDTLGVVGVAHNDFLNVRAKPGTDHSVVTTAGPAVNNLISSGRARALPDSIWYEVTADGTLGWVSASFVAFLGATDDATAEFLADGGSVSAETMTDLGQLVADRFASDDPPSRVVESVAPTVGDLGEVTYDVVGLGDDAIHGYRLQIFATVEGSDSFTVRNIERTLLCSRGISGRQVCS